MFDPDMRFLLYYRTRAEGCGAAFSNMRSCVHDSLQRSIIRSVDGSVRERIPPSIMTTDCSRVGSFSGTKCESNSPFPETSKVEVPRFTPSIARTGREYAAYCTVTHGTFQTKSVWGRVTALYAVLVTQWLPPLGHNGRIERGTFIALPRGLKVS